MNETEQKEKTVRLELRTLNDGRLTLHENPGAIYPKTTRIFGPHESAEECYQAAAKFCNTRVSGTREDLMERLRGALVKGNYGCLVDRMDIEKILTCMEESEPADDEKEPGTKECRTWTVRCVRKLYEYNTVQIEPGASIEETLAKAQEASYEEVDGWEFGKHTSETKCDAAAPGAHQDPEDGQMIEIPVGFQIDRS